VNASFDQVTHWIKSRQSIFPASFTGGVVNDSLITQILENANTAPSHRNTEPWRFRVISSDKLESFADFMQSSYKAHTPPGSFKQKKYDKTRSKILKSSHLVILSMQRDPAESVPEWEELAATACAIQNIYLSLKSLGLGGYWSTPAYLIDNIEDYTSMEEGERCLGLFYIGVAGDELPPIKEKGSLTDKVKWL